MDKHGMATLIRRLSWFVALGVTVMVVSGGFYYSAQQRAVRDLATARAFGRAARTSAALATDRQTGIRGYLLTRDQSVLLPDAVARARLPGLIDSLESLASGNEQQARVRDAISALARWDREYAQPVVNDRPPAGGEALVGKPLFDSVRARFRDVTASADAESARRYTSARRLELVGALTLLIELLAFVGALLYLIRGRLVAQAEDLAHQQHLLEQQAVELEVQIEEIASVNQSLSQSVTETQRKDAALRSSLRQSAETAAFLDSALDSAPIGLAFWDTDLRYVRVNGQLAANSGIAAGDFVGKTMAEVSPDVARDVEPILQDVLRSGTVVSDVDLVRRGHGTTPPRYLRATFYPVTTPDGDMLAVGAFSTDITEARERDERVRRSEERYRYVAKATNDAIYEWVGATNTFNWSEGMLTLFGYAEADIENTPEWITSLIHPADEQRISDAFAAAVSAGAETWRQSYRLRKNDGKYASVEGRAYIIRDEQGAAVRVIGAITDRTKEDSLEEQLRQAQKMDAVGRLAGGIAHDFNNILTVIKMSSEFLLEDMSDPEESRNEANQIRSAADRAAALTRQLLAFSRHQVLNPRLVMLNEVVTGLQSMVRRVVPENIQITTELDPDLDPVMADTGQLEQVILNLVINAADAMASGGRLSIRTSNVEVDAIFSSDHLDLDPGRYVCLMVSDSGHGMDKETASRIFEPFFTTKAVGKGTGLGLATVHGIITQTGGKVWVYSEPSQGTTFKIFIPGTEGVASTIEVRPLATLRPASETILLVEDEVATRDAVERGLIRAGYKVVLASNGLEALGIANANAGAIDLVLTDSMMPEMGGLEMVGRLKETHPETRVLMMSGYIEQTASSRFGVSEQPFIEKPFSTGELLAAIQRVLHGEPLDPAA